MINDHIKANKTTQSLGELSVCEWVSKIHIYWAAYAAKKKSNDTIWITHTEEPSGVYIVLPEPLGIILMSGQNSLFVQGVFFSQHCSNTVFCILEIWYTILARAVGVAVGRRSGGQLATRLVDHYCQA